MPKKKMPRISEVKALDPFWVKVAFESGRQTDIDLSGMVNAFKVYAPLREDEKLFASVRVGEWGWHIKWTKDMDMSAETLMRLHLEQTGEAMKQEEFTAWMECHGLSLDTAAKALGISRRMAAYYKSGQRIIPKTIRLACKGAGLEFDKAG